MSADGYQVVVLENPVAEPPSGVAAARITPDQELAAALLEVAQLREALVSSRRIGAALGILMVRQGWTEDMAWDALCRASQNHNRKVRHIAERVVLEGRLPL